MIATKLMLDVHDYLGYPDLVLCNGARISFVYEELRWPPSRPDYVDFEVYSGVFLSEYEPPRPWGLDMTIEDLEPIDLPF